MSEPAQSILFVLDSKEASATIENAFARDGSASALDIVYSLAQAREYLSRQTPDMTVAQYQLPDGTGPELAGDGANSYPLVLLVDEGQEEEFEQSPRAGVFDYLLATRATFESLPKLLLLQRQLWRLMKQINQAERLAELGSWERAESDNRLIHCSEGYARMLSMRPEEVKGGLVTREQEKRSIHPNDRERYLKAVADSAVSGEGLNIEYRRISPDGSTHFLHEIGEVAKDHAGRVVRYAGVAGDITEHTLAQKQLTKSLAGARRAEQLVNLGTYVWDWSEGRLVDCSEEYARILELTVDEALQTLTTLEADYGFLHPDDRERFAATEAEMLATATGYSTEYRIQLPSGRIRYIREVADVELNDQGEVIRSKGSMQDVSEQVRLEQQLRQAQKLEAVGQLTGGICHDFNNMLMVIKGNLELAEISLPAGHSAIQLLRIAEEAAERGATLTRRLLTFSRDQPLQFQTVDIHSLLSGMEPLLRQTLGETVNVDVQRSDSEWLCETDAAQLESAILNLAINARDAMPDGGSLGIGLDSVILNEDYVSAYEALSPGAHVCISVRDTGVGMSREVLEQACNPFFTTKGVGEGTGLGLSMVYGFLRQCGGHLNIYSEPGTGTVVKIYLPEKRDGVVEPTGNQGVEGSRGDDELVVVVEDDMQVRTLAVRLLQGLGYQTLEAENAAAAILLLKDHASIALLFTDVVLPGGMNGVELAADACSRYPDLKVLLTSGYRQDAELSRGRSGYSYLEKPYTRTALADALSRLISLPNPPSPT